MKYIPLYQLRSLVQWEGDEDRKSKLETYLTSLEEEGNLTEEKAHIKEQLGLLLKEENVLFHEWIAQDKNILVLLEEHVLKGPNRGMDNLQNHPFFGNFKRFLSPYLSPVLLSLLEGEEGASWRLCSYFNLLDEDNRSFLQGRVQRKMDEQWKAFEQEIGATKKEKDFLPLLNKVFSEDQIRVLNQFSKSHYRTKVSFIERAGALLKHPAMTERASYWLIRRCQQLELNEEHKDYLEQLTREIEVGSSSFLKGKVSKTKARNRRILWRSIIAVSAVLLAVAIFNFLPKMEEDESDYKETLSAFEQFSVKERRELDSVIRTMEPEKVERRAWEKEQLHGLHLQQVSIPIVDREQYRNEKVNAFVENSFKAVSIVESGERIETKPYGEKELQSLTFDGMSSFKKVQKGKRIYVRNASDIQVQLVLFEDRREGRVYTRLLSQGEDIRFEAKEGWALLLLPGDQMASFKAEDEAKNKPDTRYRHHFLSTDEHYEDALNKAYTISNLKEKESRVLLNRTREGVFYVLDVSEVLK